MSTELANYKIMAKILMFATVPLFLIMPFITLSPLLVMLFVALYYIGLIIFLMPEAGLLLLILLRPLLDFLSGEPIINLGGFSLNLASISALIVLAYSAWLIIKKFNQLKALPLKPYIGSFLLIALVSSFISYDQAASLTEWLRLLSIFSLYLLGFFIFNTHEKLERLIKFIIASAIMPGLFAIYQFFTDTGLTVPLEGIYNRIYGSFSHPNLLAYYLVIPLTLLCYQLFKKTDKKPFLINSLLIIFFLTLLALTYTRGAWLAFVLTFGVIGAVSYKKLLIALLGLVLLAYFLVTPIQEKVYELVFSRQTSIDWRISLWQDSIGYTLDKPLFGQGTGVASEYILLKRGDSFGSTDPHNDYLKIMIENGFLGLLAYLAVIFSLLTYLINSLRQNQNKHKQLISLFLLALATSLYVLSFADNIIRNTALQWSFWLLIGSALAYLKSEKNIKL